MPKPSQEPLYHAEWKRLYRASKRDIGQCTECSHKAKQGFATCAYHLEYTREKVRNRRLKQRKTKYRTK